MKCTVGESTNAKLVEARREAEREAPNRQSPYPWENDAQFKARQANEGMECKGSGEDVWLPGAAWR